MKGQISSVNGSLLPQFPCYTLAKLIRCFSDIQNRILDFEVAALDMVNLEWFYICPQSRINLPFAFSFIFLGDIGETKLIRETTLKNHISGSLRGISIFEIWAGIALVSTSLGEHQTSLMCTHARCSNGKWSRG